MQEYTLSDLAAATGGNRNNGGFGDGDGALWIILLIALFGGFGNNRGGFGGGNGGGGNGGGYPYPYGAGFVGGNELYPWLNNSQNINDGFRDQMLQTNVQGIQQGINALSTQLCNCCCDMRQTVSDGFAGTNANIAAGFAGVEQGANARAVAAMQQAFAQQTATMQGFNGVQAQLADCCCENRLATANQTATILAENCADRAAIADGVRDIIQSQTLSTQRILDQLCADKIDAKNDEIAQLRQQLNMQALAASQIAQTAQIQAGQVAEVDALYQRLRDCPVGTMPVYGNQPIFTCPQNQGCGCGCGNNGGCGCGM